METFDYKKQAEYLTKHPIEITTHWIGGLGMFKMVGSTDKIDEGCLTIIRKSSTFYAYIKGERDLILTAAIREDERLPRYAQQITPEHFSVFIEWQEKIDQLQNS